MNAEVIGQSTYLMIEYLYLLDMLAAAGIAMYGAFCFVSPLPPQIDIKDNERLIAATAVMEACKAGLSVAAIVFPILVGIQILILDRSKEDVVQAIPVDFLNGLRITSLWIGVSLIVGLYAMCYIPRIAHHKSPLNFNRKVGFFGSVQLILLMVGLIRSLAFLYALKKP